jgi:hypothetical protein
MACPFEPRSSRKAREATGSKWPGEMREAAGAEAGDETQALSG